jgi:hypothetical protein
MKFANATNLNRKSGEAEGSAVRLIRSKCLGFLRDRPLVGRSFVGHDEFWLCVLLVMGAASTHLSTSSWC